MEDIGLDGLLVFGALERLLKNFRQEPPEGSVFRRAGLLSIFAVKQADIDGLAEQVQQVLLREFDKPRAQINVIMNVVNA